MYHDYQVMNAVMAARAEQDARLKRRANAPKPQYVSIPKAPSIPAPRRVAN